MWDCAETASNVAGACCLITPDAMMTRCYPAHFLRWGNRIFTMRNAEAIGKHWCLVFVAYSLLHLDCLSPSPAKGSSPLKTIGEACRQQAQALIQALILYAHERLQLGQRAEDIFAHVFAKQQTTIAR